MLITTAYLYTILVFVGNAHFKNARIRNDKTIKIHTTTDERYIYSILTYRIWPNSATLTQNSPPKSRK